MSFELANSLPLSFYKVYGVPNLEINYVLINFYIFDLQSMIQHIWIYWGGPNKLITLFSSLNWVCLSISAILQRLSRTLHENEHNNQLSSLLSTTNFTYWRSKYVYYLFRSKLLVNTMTRHNVWCFSGITYLMGRQISQNIGSGLCK
jgi:hypothetical protein